MKWRKPQFGLPLLTKELVEQAARRQTYILRVVYALLLFVAAGIMFASTLAAGSHNLFAILGSGRQMFDRLLMLQFAGIYLFMPAMTASVVTGEKERNTLGLLFLTRLGPWAIVFEKLLSRAVPMLGFQLLSMPLLAFAYSFGGISQESVWTGAWVLVVTTFQFGALCVMCSTYFRTTLGALVGTYVIAGALFFGPALVSAAALFYFGGPMQSSGAIQRLLAWDGPLLWMTFGPAASERMYDSRTPISIWFVLKETAPLIVSGLVFLAIARHFLVSRAFLNPVNPLIRFFRALDGFFERINQNSITRGVVLVREDTSLPDARPVSWRETKKRSLGKTTWLIRIFVLLETFVCFVAVTSAADYRRGMATGHAGLTLWLLAIAVVAVAGANLFSSERSRQTLDVLLSTPMTTREIVLQKYAGIVRLCVVLSMPIFTMVAIKSWLTSNALFSPWAMVLSYLGLLIYLPLFGWLACLISLRSTTQSRAVVMTFVLIAAWFVVPYMMLLPFSRLFSSSNELQAVTLMSPATLLIETVYSQNSYTPSGPGRPLLNFAIYAVLAFVIRMICLAKADKWLGRTTPPFGWAKLERSPRTVPTMNREPVA